LDEWARRDISCYQEAIMSEIERRWRELANRLTAWFQSSSSTAKQRGSGSSEQLRKEAKARAQQAASRVQDFRGSDRGQRAEAKINDLRTSDAGQKAQATLADLRQREPVKKAEENARKVLHDLFSGPGGSGTGTPGASGSGTAGTTGASGSGTAGTTGS
jgi:hypothetical protein